MYVTLKKRFQEYNPLYVLYNHIVNYPTPINLSYLWGLGSIAGIFLVIQILTGIFLAMYYVPTVELAFDSVEYIMREVNYGWLIRYLHANGASFFFISVFLHISRGLYYQSYYVLPGVWVTGILILLLMMGTAFMGYVLPYGQMSYWGATVITNFVSVIPVWGKHIVEWLWGGFCVDHPTLHRFFSIHFLLPFVILGLMFVHLIFLHVKGSSNPLGIHPMRDFVSFHPYFTVKDILGLFWFLFPYLFVVFFYPNLLGHPDNYVPANPMVTPLHIVPEWYFLPFYAILRCTDNKMAGIIHMISAILGLIVLPWWPWKIYSFANSFVKSVLPKVHASVKNYVEQNESLNLIKQCFSFNGQFGVVHNPDFRPIFKFAIYLFFVNFIILGAMGSQPPVEPYVTISRITMLYYFYFFIIGLPFFHGFENLLWAIYTKNKKA